jgi:hypothetical protein
LGVFVGGAGSRCGLSRPSAAVLLEFLLMLLLFALFAAGKFGLQLRVGGGVFGVNDGLLEGHKGLGRVVLHGSWLGVGGFVDEFEAAVSGHALRKGLGSPEVVNVIHGSGGLCLLVTNVDDPNGDLLAFVVLIGLWAIEENAAPKAGGGCLAECGTGVSVKLLIRTVLEPWILIFILFRSHGLFFCALLLSPVYRPSPL